MYSQTVLLGVIISLIYTEITGLSAGMILSGYLVLSLHSPLRVIYTLVVALTAMGLCRLMSRGMILYGRRRFAVLILTAAFLCAAASALDLVPVSAIGVVVPGLLAREFDRQGILNTLLSLTVTTGLTALCLLLLGQQLLI